jgi:DNA-binding NtrC family response regulator
VYGIVAQSNGGVYVHSDLGHGTRFEVYLPRADQYKGTSGEELKSTGQAAPGGATILLVEDDEIVRTLFHEELKDRGYKLLVASGGEEAIRLCQKNPGEIDLVLTDVVMPDLSGPELVQQLQPFFPNMRVLYMTGYTDAVIANHGLSEDSIELMQKPFTIGALVSKVHQILEDTD